jgi:predicted transcriptional regulator
VGFLIKGGDKETQKIMAMYMSQGFGITADMKAKGVYEITVKAVIDNVTLMDRFNHEMK